MNLTFNIYNLQKKLSAFQIDILATFLECHLGKYGDKKQDIISAIEYALSLDDTPGGFVILVTDDNDDIVGASVVNKTGMKGYIPSHILVYIAVHEDGRGHGIGQQIMTRAIKEANGDIALHVEPNNPAKRLYEKLGFTNKYLEMRYQKPN